VKLTQSSAIIRYIARKHKLDGATEEEKQRVDQIEGETGDMKGAFAGMCYNPNFVSQNEMMRWWWWGGGVFPSLLS
jgi:glutathione S-transferase